MRVVLFLKTAGKILLIFLLGVFITTSLIGVFYEKEIKQLVIGQINKSLNTRIQVGEFDFTVLRHFPNASLEMKDVVIDEVTDKKIPDTLLYSKRLSLLFNIKDVFSKEVSIKKILIYDGGINICVSESGRANYIFWKKSEGSEEASEITIKKIGLKNVYLSYIDKKADQDYSIHAKQAELSGRFATDKFSFHTQGDLFVDKLFVHGENYVDHKPVVIRSGLQVDSKTGIYIIDESDIKIAGIPFRAGGTLTDAATGWFLDLAVDAKSADLKELNKIIPSFFHVESGKYKANGKVAFHATVKGSVSNKNVPSVAIDFNVNNGSIAAGEATFEKLNFSGTFRNPDGNRKNSLNIPMLTAAIAGHPINASLRLDDLPNAYLTLQAKTQLNLSELLPFLHADTIESLSGDLAMNVFYRGKVRELRNMNREKLPDVKASGNIDISNVNFKLKKNPLIFKNLNGSFTLHDRDVTVKNFTGNISSTDFRLEGVFKNFISFLLIHGQSGEMLARLESKTVDLDELLVNKSSTGTGDTSYIMKFNPRLLCALDVNIDHLRFRHFSADNICGKVNLEKQVISSNNLRFRAMDGSIALNATINAARRDSVSMFYDAQFTKVDITRLFYEMENFDQQTMTDKNVKGKVSADILFASMWSNDLTLNSKSVRSTGSVIIENGELLNFAPIRAMAKYIHVPDLNHIRFSTLKNTISIADRKIQIPNMDIHSSAINISGNGTHDFDNNVDYHLALLLSDVLGQKAAAANSEFGEIADDGLGRTKLFLAMKGTVTEPRFSYDKKAAGEKIKNDITREKQNLKGILKQELGFYKHQPSVQAPPKKKKEEMQIDWSKE